MAGTIAAVVVAVALIVALVLIVMLKMTTGRIFGLRLGWGYALLGILDLLWLWACLVVSIRYLDYGIGDGTAGLITLLIFGSVTLPAHLLVISGVVRDRGMRTSEGWVIAALMCLPGAALLVLFLVGAGISSA